MTLKVIHYDLGHKNNKTLYDIRVIQYDLGQNSNETIYDTQSHTL